MMKFARAEANRFRAASGAIVVIGFLRAGPTC